MSGDVTSHATHFPVCHGMRVHPSGLLPSERRSPAGSFIAAKPAFVSDLWTMSFSKLYLMILPLLRRQASPWVPLASTRSPHMHEWGVQRLQPSLMPTAILIASSSSRRPKAEIGRAFSQSPEWESIAAFNLA